MKYCIILIAIISSYCCNCYANRMDARELVLDSVIHKICNIAETSLANVLPEDKDKVLKKIEFRMKKSTEKYDRENVKLIIQGVKAMSKENDYRLCHQQLARKILGTYEPENDEVRHDNITEIHTDKNTIKNNLVKEMAYKIEKLAKKSFQNTTTDDEKRNILEQIQKRLIETVKQKEISSGGNGNKTDTYVSLIMEGIQQVIKKSCNDSRRMTIDLHEKQQQESDNTKFNTNKKKYHESTTRHNFVQTTRTDCSSITKNICSDLKSLNEFTCLYDDTVIPLLHVCDGSVGCPDGSDEKTCPEHAINRVHSASLIISAIGMSYQCFSELVSSHHLSIQESVLKDLLQKQLDFIKRHKGNSSAKDTINPEKIEHINEVTSEALSVVRAFATVLQGTLCDFSEEDVDELIESYYEVLDKASQTTVSLEKFLPKSCVCQEAYCKEATCADVCKSFCYQKNTLRQWTCPTIDGQISLSFDLLCDGKLDCLDESDEMNCAADSSSKFEASKIFGNIITALTLKSKLKEYQPIWHNLLVLQNAIKKIQERSMKTKVNLVTYRVARDNIFNISIAAYVDFLDSSRDMEKGEPIYKFFLYVHDQLVGALKRSQMGNVKMVSDDECFCRGAKCATQICSNKCSRICSATPALTTYACGNSNDTVPIDAVCNGKATCPNGEDELDCKKEICRGHHLKVLRHNLETVGDKYKGKILGEVLEAWKTKINSRLIVAEKRDRPTPAVVRNVIKNILADLVKSYSSLGVLQKMFNAEETIKKFKKLSQRIIETLKSCAV